MKKSLSMVFLALFAFATISSLDVWVDGYYRSDGSYVQGHYRSDPNGDKDDNWSTRGNTNPHTGKRGNK